MATRTTNYGLYKPDPTDDYADFLSEFNDNMDEIDDHLGGGGGGGGDTVVLGMYIDTDRIITSGTYSSNFSYTATEDCYLCLQVIANANDSAVVTIDSETVANEWSSATHTSPIILPVRKGQIVGATSSNPSTAYYFVYGVKQGTKGIFAPVIYSDNERVIGIWRDNKPLYQRTFHLATLTNIAYNAWTSMGVSVADGENIISCVGISSDGTNTPLMAYFNSGAIECQTPRNNSVSWNIEDLIVQYTKSTDVAGSGNWNTDGIPTVHYSTSEQVIGTWIDGKPLYQITVDVPTPVNDSNEHLIDLTALSIEECPYLFGYSVRHSGANDITYYANSIETDGWYYFKARYDNFRDSIMYTCLFRNDSISRMKFTIQYTKTTD